MASFVFYNPKTNTIEKRNPIQPNTFQMPYLLNIQPQDLNYAMKNTSDLRSYPSSVPYPDQFEKENRSQNMETRKPEPRYLNYEKPSKEFLMMEDLREEDVEGVNQPSKPNKNQNNKYSPNSRIIEQRKPSPKSPKRATFVQPEEEARGDFNIVRPEDMFLKYKPEDYSINERILNARFVQQEQEKTRKFVLDRIANDIKAMEAHTNVLEKELQATDKETQALDAKTQQIWQEIERKKFELKANEIMKKIDQAVDIDNEIEQEHRFDDFYRENAALYDEIDRALGEEGIEEEETVYYEETDRSRLPAKPKHSGYGGGRSTSGNKYNLKPGYSVTKPGPYAQSNLNPKPKRMVPGIKPGNRNQSGQRTTAANKQQNNVMFKNPKRVEDALKNAKAIVDLY